MQPKVKMKTPLNLVLAMSFFGIAITSTTNCFSQTQTVTLAVSENASQFTASYAVATNQFVQITSLAGQPVVPTVFLYHSSGIMATTTNTGTYTGLTNISVTAGYYYPGPRINSGLVTLTITTPSNPTMIPANCVVIPTDATGPVQILLESSPDLVNWTGALPGTYGASSTSRFFRVRAVATP
jgi:hypothetical protein